MHRTGKKAKISQELETISALAVHRNDGKQKKNHGNYQTNSEEVDENKNRHKYILFIIQPKQRFLSVFSHKYMDDKEVSW